MKKQKYNHDVRIVSLLLLMAMLLVLCACGGKAGVPDQNGTIDQVSTETKPEIEETGAIEGGNPGWLSELLNTESQPKAYTAYANVVKKLIDSFGTGRLDTSDGYYALYGLAIVRLIDMDNDGTEELILGFRPETMGAEYEGREIYFPQSEVWAYSHGEAICLYSSNTANQGEGAGIYGAHMLMASIDNEWLLVDGESDEFFTQYDLLGIRNGELTPVHTLEGNDFPDEWAEFGELSSFFLDGQEVSREEYLSTYDEWFSEQLYIPYVSREREQLNNVIAETIENIDILGVGTDDVEAETLEEIIEADELEDIKKAEIGDMVYTGASLNSWYKFYEDEDYVYLLYGSYYPVTSLKNLSDYKLWTDGMHDVGGDGASADRLVDYMLDEGNWWGVESALSQVYPLREIVVTGGPTKEQVETVLEVSSNCGKMLRPYTEQNGYADGYHGSKGYWLATKDSNSGVYGVSLWSWEGLFTANWVSNGYALRPLARISKYEEGFDNYTYEILDDNTVSITGYYGLAAVTTIPSEIEGYPVTSILSGFAGCDNLRTLIIPTGITSIDEYAFMNNDSLMDILVDDDNPAFISVDGVLFSKDMKTLIHYPTGRPDSSYSIPDGVTEVSAAAFMDSSSLISLTIPASVNTIGEWASVGWGVTDIYYEGSQAQWDEITVLEFNQFLFDANIHFNS